MNLSHAVKKGAALLLGLVFVTGLGLNGFISAEAEPLFDDVSSSYAQTQITHLVGKGIMNGTGTRIFAPTRPITRAEFIAVLDRVLNLQPLNSTVPAFTDVPASSWYYGWIQAGLESGIADGVGSGRFAPEKPITRQEAAALLVKALKQSTAGSPQTASVFTDASQIAAWAVPYVGQIQHIGLMEGDQGRFRPNDPITRQETAVVIDKLISDARWSTALNATPASVIQLGWQYNQTDEQYKQDIQSSGINTLSPRWFFLDTAKGIEDAAKPELVTWAHQNGKKVWPLVGNRMNKEYTHQVLSDSATSAAVVQQLAQFAEQYNVDGLNLDFENIDPADRQSLTSFVASLASRLHSMNKLLSVDVSPDAGTDWTDAFDYTALGQNADYVVLMAYDEHWDGDVVPGSVSSLPWLAKGVQSLLSAVPASKVILGLPLYTRDWVGAAGVASSSELTMSEQQELIASSGMMPVWDPNTGQYTSTYWVNSAPHSIWIEDSRSLAAKVNVGLTHHVAGFAYWYTGAGSLDVWKSIANLTRYSAYSF